MDRHQYSVVAKSNVMYICTVFAFNVPSGYITSSPCEVYGTNWQNLEKQTTEY